MKSNRENRPRENEAEVQRQAAAAARAADRRVWTRPGVGGFQVRRDFVAALRRELRGQAGR